MPQTNQKTGRLRNQFIFILIFLALILPNICYGKIINVPVDFNQIDDAIYSARDGDEIVVAPGIYHSSFMIYKNIIIRSTFNGDWNIVKKTIIDGGSDPLAVLVAVDHCIIRGFTIHTRLGVGIAGSRYQSTHATIEYNIISGNINTFDGINYGEGAGIYNCHGLIQNNIIEDNEANLGSALAKCDGTIQNNIIRNNRAHYNPSMTSNPYFVNPGKGSALYNCNGIIRNNTIIDNFRFLKDSESTPEYWAAGGLSLCKGTITNNIIYHTTMTTTLEYDDCTTPNYCLFRTTHPGIGNITGDPKFVDPARGNFHLKPDSPAIDTGKAQPDLKSDPDGHQRGLKGATGAAKGDGSNNDIGAFEALPKPVALWLPNGAPATIYGGAPLAVAWELVKPAGTDVHIYLYRNGIRIADLGRFNSPTGAGSGSVSLPNISSATADFTLLAFSVSDGAYHYATPRFKIATRTAVSPRHWREY